MTIYVVIAFALLLVHIAVQGFTVTREFGSAWNAGPRDDAQKPKGVVAGRAERALRNYLETFAAFGILAATLIAAGRADGIGATGAIVWLIARVVYLPLYLLGIPYIRSLAWTLAAIGLCMMAYRLIA